MSKTYKFKIETNSSECFKNSIIDFAEMLKSENIDLETFATENKNASTPLEI